MTSCDNHMIPLAIATDTNLAYHLLWAWLHDPAYTTPLIYIVQ